MLIFANPHSIFNGVLFVVAIFTVIGILIYIGLTRDNAVRPEFRDGFGRSMLRISRRSAFLVVFPIWLVACIWLYQSRLTSQFYGLERTDTENGIVWEFSYYRPHRFWNRYPVVHILEEDISRWTVVDDWSGKFPKLVLMVEDGSGKTYQSFGVSRRRFRDKYRKRLDEWEVKLATK